MIWGLAIFGAVVLGGIAAVVGSSSGSGGAGGGGACPPEITRYRAFRQQGPRPLASITLIVVHSTETDPHAGESVARYFASPGAGGSTQLVVDATPHVFRTLPDEVIPVAARSNSHDDANRRGVHVELCGFAHFSRAEWLALDAELSCAAAKIAAWSRLYSIPLQFVDAAGLQRGEHGVTTHAAITEAWKVVGGHIDPGPHFPMDVLLQRAMGA